MLRIKLFKWFAVLVLVIGALSAFLAFRMIGRRVVEEAQTRVRLDLSSAWAVYDAHLQHIQSIMKLSATRSMFVDICEGRKWDAPNLLNELRAVMGKTQMDFDLDFMGLVSQEGQVIARSSPACGGGDYRVTEPIIAKALTGTAASGTTLLSRAELEREASGLAERAFFNLQDTPHAAPTPRTTEDRGLVMLAAAPVEKNGRVIGALYAGVLLNRNHALVDRIQDIVFKEDLYRGTPMGTVTIFLGDTRIGTTVRLANGNRAIGTRLSQEVTERVLDNKLRWDGRAFVVKDWYLTTYDPICDLRGQVIGVLYVGILERPFRDLSRSMILRYSGLCALGLVGSLILAFFIAGRLARPLHNLAEASERMRRGEQPEAVPADDACEESARLICAFNDMTRALAERERQLKQAGDELAAANDSLRATNHAYMETVQFVSHELKSPVASMMNYAYLLREGLLGEVTPKQREALERIEAGLKRLTEMIRHYLNLARIENQELRPVRSRVALLQEVVGPTLKSMEADIQLRHMRVENGIGPDVVLHSDLNMTREVFENLLSNAVKYGREGGRITIACRPCGGMVECSVRNEGEGIAPAQQKRLFEKFSHVEGDAPAGTPRGTGLGLFISKQIVEAHGGAIAVESQPGAWAEFRFTLPSAPDGGSIQTEAAP